MKEWGVHGGVWGGHSGYERAGEGKLGIVEKMCLISMYGVTRSDRGRD